MTIAKTGEKFFLFNGMKSRKEEEEEEEKQAVNEHDLVVAVICF